MNLFRRFFIWFLGKFTRWLHKSELVSGSAYVSITHYLEENIFPLIILYKSASCDLCKEIEIFLKSHRIPYLEVKCKQYIPLRISTDKNLDRYFGYRVKFKKQKQQIFIPPIFPQLELVDRAGKWEKIVGDTNQMRKKVDEFITKNSDKFPGFEQGIFGNKTPANQAADQISNIFRKMKNGHDN